METWVDENMICVFCELSKLRKLFSTTVGTHLLREKYFWSRCIYFWYHLINFINSEKFLIFLVMMYLWRSFTEWIPRFDILINFISNNFFLCFIFNIWSWIKHLFTTHEYSNNLYTSTHGLGIILLNNFLLGDNETRNRYLWCAQGKFYSCKLAKHKKR